MAGKFAFLAAASLAVAACAGASLASSPLPASQGTQVEKDAATAAAAKQALADDRAGEAADLLETLVAPRHHTLGIAPEWHLDLARAYRKLLLHDAAEGQYRLAIAAAGNEGAGAIREELEQFPAGASAATLVPDTLGPNGAKYHDLRWVDRGNGQVDFAGAFVLPADGAAGAAYMTATYRADCNAMQSHLVEGAEYAADGARIRTFDAGQAKAPSNALDRHMLEMTCARPANLKVATVPAIDGPALVKHYRGQLAARVALRDPADAVCRANVEIFVETIAAGGPVANPTWQVRDWWDERTEDVPDAQMAKAITDARSLARTYPGIAEALQSKCVQAAIEAGAVPGL